MARPRKEDWQKIKRLARYLAEVPRLVWRFTEDKSQDDMIQIDVFTDTDWAGDKKTRKSTSGGMIAVAGGVCKSWAGTQSTIAASSGEAEYYSLIKGAAEGLGFQAMASDLGVDAYICVWGLVYIHMLGFLIYRGTAIYTYIGVPLYLYLYRETHTYI